MAIELEPTTLVRKARRQAKDAANKLMGKRAIVADVFTLKTPNWLSVAVLEVKMNASSDICRSRARVRAFGLGWAGRETPGGIILPVRG